MFLTLTEELEIPKLNHQLTRFLLLFEMILSGFFYSLFCDFYFISSMRERDSQQPLISALRYKTLDYLNRLYLRRRYSATNLSVEEA